MAKMATAVLNPVNNSGVSAQLMFSESDDGNLLTVAGTANGMQLLGIYVSLVYGLQSNADVIPPFTPPGPCVDDRTLGVEPAPIPSGMPANPSNGYGAHGNRYATTLQRQWSLRRAHFCRIQ